MLQLRAGSTARRVRADICQGFPLTAFGTGTSEVLAEGCRAGDSRSSCCIPARSMHAPCVGPACQETTKSRSLATAISDYARTSSRLCSWPDDHPCMLCRWHSQSYREAIQLPWMWGYGSGFHLRTSHNA